MSAVAGAQCKHTFTLFGNVTVDVAHDAFGNVAAAFVDGFENAGIDLFFSGECGEFDFTLRIIISARNAVEFDL